MAPMGKDKVMKKVQMTDVFVHRPRVIAVFRIISKKCWLVKQHRARVGEEFAFTKDTLGFNCAGPLVPGTSYWGVSPARYNPGPPTHWEFQEYRVSYKSKQLLEILP